MSIELIIQATEDLDWKQCEESGMWVTTDGEHSVWLDSDNGGYYVEVSSDPDNTDMWLPHHDAVIHYIERFTEPFMIANMAECEECGTLLHSKHRHDFVGCECPQESRLYIDGGNDYVKVVGALHNRISKCVTSASQHSKIREVLYRGGYGKDGKQPYAETLMKDMSDDYLDNLIKYFEEVDEYKNKYYSMYLTEKMYRKWHNISIKG